MSRINHNISSLRAINELVANQADLGVRLERLSSGLRINRGKDDPAGLIASENLRAEISGINGALQNAVRANNVISTAEGALNEVSALLLEIRGLITTAANTGAMGDEELAANQLQVDSILESIDRIANTTQFNGKKLLDGSLEYSLSGVDSANMPDVRIYSARVPDGGALPVVVEVTDSAETAVLRFSGTQVSGNTAIRLASKYGSEVFSFTSNTANSSIADAVNSFKSQLGISAVATASSLYFYSTDYGEDAFVSVKSIGTWDFTIGGATDKTDYGKDVTAKINGQSANADGLQVSLRNSSLDLELVLSSTFGTTLGGDTFYVTGGGATFQLGPTVNLQGQESLGLLSVGTSSLGNSDIGYLSSIGGDGANSLVGGNGIAAGRIVDQAIKQTAVIRGRLGAFQKNTIETTVNSLQVALENVTASESAIRDTDFADETAKMTRAQILVQATTSVLRIANSSPQNVLALLS